MSKIEKRMVKTSDGKDMLTWVIYPPDFDPAKSTLLCSIASGPQSQVSQFYSFRWNFQLMAAKGYIVVAPTVEAYRALAASGMKILVDWGGQPMRDYLSAIDDVKAEPFVDETKLAVWAPATEATRILPGRKSWKRLKTFISHCGLFDLENWYLTTEELFFCQSGFRRPILGWKEYENL